MTVALEPEWVLRASFGRAQPGRKCLRIGEKVIVGFAVDFMGRRYRFRYPPGKLRTGL